MAQPKDIEHAEAHLFYKKGDLIIKEGDYGISIYKVMSGRVKVTKESSGVPVTLAHLGPGEIFGEMAFLDTEQETRSASVRAQEECEIEVWHPSGLRKEYQGMSPIMRYVVSQSLNRLISMNAIYSHLMEKKKQERKKEEPKEQSGRRRSQRRNVVRPCVYRSLAASPDVRLQGRISDIDTEGAVLEVDSKNREQVNHDPGSDFRIFTSLPDGLSLQAVVTVRSVKMSDPPGILRLVVKFKSLSGDSARRLLSFLTSRKS